MPEWTNLISNIQDQVPKTDKSGHEEAKNYPKAHADRFLTDLEWRINSRGWLTPSLFALVVGYLACVLLIVITDASCSVFSVPESVLTVMIASGSANVIGMFLIVARYLFPKDSHLQTPSLMNQPTPSD